MIIKEKVQLKRFVFLVLISVFVIFPISSAAFSSITQELPPQNNKVISQTNTQKAETIKNIPKQDQAKKQKKPLQGKVEVGDQLIVEATAYTAGYESTGKRPGDKGYGITFTGTKFRKGIIAVDPKVIPLGTKVWIEGYGEAIAEDTGSAIKGYKIDVAYYNLQDALEWGRKKVKMKILELPQN